MILSKGVVDIDLGFKHLISELRKAAKIEVAVGIFEDSVDKNGKQIALYAAANEYGAKLKNGAEIPSRPFMRSSFDESKDEIASDLTTAARMIVGGASAHSAIGMVGHNHQKRIVEKIQSSIPPPNAESTVKRKGHARTLIDTGAMLKSVKNRVRSKGGI